MVYNYDNTENVLPYLCEPLPDSNNNDSDLENVNDASDNDRLNNTNW